MHPSAYKDAERFAKKYLDPNKSYNILDIGSYDVNGTLRPIFEKPNWKYTGADLQEGPNVDVVLEDEYWWPELDEYGFNVIVSSQVLEHVKRPWAWFEEVWSVLIPGGLLYVASLNTWPYHAYPTDCYRFWPDGMRALMEESEMFDVIECYANGSDTVGIARKEFM